MTAPYPTEPASVPAPAGDPAVDARTGTAVSGPVSGAGEVVHGPVDFALSDAARALLFDGVAANTRRAYARQWRGFTAWCAAAGRSALPATQATLAEYVAHLCSRELAPASITQAIAAIRTAHATAGHRGQPETRAATLALRGHRRRRAEHGQRHQRQAPPVVIDTLRAMVATCDPATAAGVRDRLLLVLGLALMGRRSELAALDLDDVTETPEGLEVRVRMSKTDQDAHGETIAIPRGAHPITDPVAAWRDWTALLADLPDGLPDGQGIASGRLLRSVDRHGRIGAGITGDAINRAVRRLAIAADVPAADTYTAHSLRAGGATVAYAAGVPISVIARHGRWAPTSPVLLGYIRAVDRWRDNAMRDVGL